MERVEKLERLAEAVRETRRHPSGHAVEDFLTGKHFDDCAECKLDAALAALDA